MNAFYLFSLFKWTIYWAGVVLREQLLKHVSAVRNLEKTFIHNAKDGWPLFNWTQIGASSCFCCAWNLSIWFATFLRLFQKQFETNILLLFREISSNLLLPPQPFVWCRSLLQVQRWEVSGSDKSSIKVTMISYHKLTSQPIDTQLHLPTKTKILWIHEHKTISKHSPLQLWRNAPHNAGWVGYSPQLQVPY